MFSRYDNLEVDWLLLEQLVRDTIQSLCEYFLMTSSLMEEAFLKRNRGGGGYSLQQPIRRGSTQKEYLI